MFEKMLIPVDGSRCSEAAALFALRLARRLGSRVAFAHVVDEEVVEDSVGPIAEAEERAEALGRALLEHWQSVARAEEVSAALEPWLVRGRDVGEAIVRTAEESGASLIAMGTHGREGVERALLGSVAERVARLADVPVLLARREAAERWAGRPLERLLVPVDGSPVSDLALRAARRPSPRLWPAWTGPARTRCSTRRTGSGPRT